MIVIYTARNMCLQVVELGLATLADVFKAAVARVSRQAVAWAPALGKPLGLIPERLRQQKKSHDSGIGAGPRPASMAAWDEV